MANPKSKPAKEKELKELKEKAVKMQVQRVTKKGSYGRGSKAC